MLTAMRLQLTVLMTRIFGRQFYPLIPWHLVRLLLTVTTVMVLHTTLMERTVKST